MLQLGFTNRDTGHILIVTEGIRTGGPDPLESRQHCLTYLFR
jgi:hypothetical protein